MADRVRYHPDKDVIMVRTMKLEDNENFMDYVDAIKELSRDRDTSEVVVDARQLHRMENMSKVYRFGEKLCRDKEMRKMRIAILPGQKSEESVTFFENVVVNRGLRVRSFKEEEGALEWLKGEENTSD